jgi:hypothetical protein
MTNEQERYLADLLEELLRRIELIEKAIEAISARDGPNPEEERLKAVTHPLLVTASVGSGKSLMIAEVLSVDGTSWLSRFMPNL